MDSSKSIVGIYFEKFIHYKWLPNWSASILHREGRGFETLTAHQKFFLTRVAYQIQYDAKNRLIEIDFSGVNKSVFTYDGEGHRVEDAETVSGTTTTVHYL